ncbi:MULTISPECIES: hypothetical protein [Thermosipho]|uniref:hypothetical protein n=1 Tax=Thermosipho TaxID=2420 RepID=UPI001E34F358|nr:MULTISPECIES: hypothetical protein [Thermosipho]
MIKLKKFDFVIENYSKQKLFSSFLPGIAGKNGIPLWVFYVNRGQCIASFGIENKANSILEFKPAGQSHTDTPLKGFRTFIKVDGRYYEPFSELTNFKREMRINKNSLEIEERNNELGLKVKVIYFVLPNEDFAALVRRVEIENEDKYEKHIEIIDGLPEVIPYGVSNGLYKEMGYTARAWMHVYNYEKKVPFYSVRTTIGDLEIVEEINNGYFYFASSGDELLEVIYDKNVLFGNSTSLQVPLVFKELGIKEVLRKEQYDENLLPSAFGVLERKLKDKVVINSMIGFSKEKGLINNNINTLKKDEYIISKKEEADLIVEELVSEIKTKTSNKLFDKYCEQNYLDNVLRGGYPLVFENKDGKVVYHIYSRKHGDLERDYNFFVLEAKKYSQGNGNFRDVAQNRRNDVIFHPEIEDFNLSMFVNLIQADGNNPLVVKGTRFKFEGDPSILDGVNEELKEFILNNYFTPGEILEKLKDKNVNEDEFVSKILYHSSQHEQAEFGEGYWIDHWTYLMDLVDTYKEIYPDKLQKTLFEKFEYKIYDSHAYVKPRKEKYKLYKGKVRQIAAVGESHEKLKIIQERGHNYLTDRNGNIYKTNMFEKLLLLAVNKFATLDPYGMGLEMEANKPGWNDALNGLPALFGSGMSETFELKRLINFMYEELKKYNKDIEVFEELQEFIQKIKVELENYFNDNDQFIYWDNVSNAKEEYRSKVFYSITGNKKKISKVELLAILKKMIKKLDEGIERAKNYGKGIYPTFFTYELVDYEVIDGVIIPKKFEVNVLPYFLEGIVRAFKVIDKDEKKKLYDFVKNSNIYDKKLKMYKTSESILNQPYSIGRIRAFTPGWLENESVFMHMEFKYLLELIKSDMLEEFYEDIKTALPPYMDYKVYGRSILENSSFIVSSANSNPNLHGQGFYARLSGSTAEFLSMWKYMFIGDKLFTLENNELTFTFEPKINKEFFENGVIEFKLFSKTKVKYVNPQLKEKIGRIEVFVDGKKFEIHGNKIKGELAHKLRNKKIDEVICYFE